MDGTAYVLRWDAAPAVLEWVVRVSERRDARGGYVVREERVLPRGATSVEVPLGANALRVHLLGRGRGGKLVRRAVMSPLTPESWSERWQRRASALSLELAAGAVEARVDAVAGAEHADGERATIRKAMAVMP